jgi:hypothetical protein
MASRNAVACTSQRGWGSQGTHSTAWICLGVELPNHTTSDRSFREACGTAGCSTQSTGQVRAFGFTPQHPAGMPLTSRAQACRYLSGAGCSRRRAAPVRAADDWSLRAGAPRCLRSLDEMPLVRLHSSACGHRVLLPARQCRGADDLRRHMLLP